MNRRRIILPVLALVVTAFAIAVQRDTFVRRWCLPSPPPMGRPPTVLDRVYADFPIGGFRGFEAFGKFEQRTDTKVHFEGFDHDGLLGVEFPRSPGLVRNATAEQILSRIAAPLRLYVPLNDPLLVLEDRDVFAASGTPRRCPTVGHVYDVRPQLLHPNVQWRVLTWDSKPNALVGTWNERIENKIRSLTAHVVATARASDYTLYQRPVPVYAGFDPVLRFGDRLIVITTDRNHWLINQLLSEEAEAQDRAAGRSSAAGR